MVFTTEGLLEVAIAIYIIYMYLYISTLHALYENVKLQFHQKDIFLKGRNASATSLGWFASDTTHFWVHLYNICTEASALLYGEEQSF